MMERAFRFLAVGCLLSMAGVGILEAKSVAAQGTSGNWVPVLFLEGSAYSKDGDQVRLLNGSVWRVENPYLLIVPTDVIIIRWRDRRDPCGVMVSRHFQGATCRVSGSAPERRGYLTSVVRAIGGGAVLETADGSLWEVPEYDQYDTGYWLPPYEVIVTSDELYMYNIKESKKVWVTRVAR